MRISPGWIFLLLLAPVLGCQCNTSPAVLTYGRSADADTLDPINTDHGESVKVMVNLYDTLLTYADDSMELVPSLATDLGQMSDDGLTWTFSLRKGVLFHDGEPFNSDAVKFSFDRLIQEQHPGVYNEARPYRTAYSEIIESVEAPAPDQVVFHLKKPSAIFQRNLAMFAASIVSPKSVLAKNEDFAIQPVGTGPFQLERWERGRRIVLQAFDKHWRGAPAAERVVFLPVTEPATRVQQIERGIIHIADNLPPTTLDNLVENPQIAAQSQPGTNVGYLSMQIEKPGLSNLKVRQAIALAIDKAELVRTAYGGYSETAATMLPRSMAYWHNDQIEDRKLDIEGAKKLMQEAADADGFALPLKLTLATMGGARPYMQQPLEVASFIKDALAPIGIEVEIVTRAVSEHFDYLMAGKHELALAGWSSDNNDPDNFLYMLFDQDNIGPSGNNLSRYRNQELHDLLIAAQSELDRDKRREMYLQAQQMIFDDVPALPLVNTAVRIALRDSVRDYQLHPSAQVWLRKAHLEVGK
ncbi:ABC transporter substrate-binding protein [Lignipirellula cremea]|uniref:Periplasmic dipeptide transport protein n=1 Tax=Lignipirellula cremea TaxID=2528010 RepID=A0A518DTQ9_9BACT|nr:ABC transporter substrate-binding protein [Lignipirellula cremea]QDU95220.1 Periplasmic dipeptide transport protein precursor [Lignipirellula cremea]